MKIIISGSTGLVGSRIIELLKDDFNFIPLLATQVDITENKKVDEFITSNDFDLFLHLAAYTNVNGAELEKDIAYKINVEGTKNVFNSVLKKNKKFIYISTDFVFSGDNQDGFYTEQDIPSPSGTYAKTKYEGEKVVKDTAMIVRISYPFRARFEEKKDFVSSIKSTLEKEQEINAVTDSIITPTFIDDIAYGLKHLINNYSPEIYHLAGTTNISPYNAFRLISNVFGLNNNLIKPTTFSSHYKEFAAIRPQYSVLKSMKNDFWKMSSFEDGLFEIKKQLN